MSYIIHTRLNNEIETRAVDDKVLVIGRAADAQLQLGGDAVELRHARIEHGNGHYLLINESSAGTYVNGLRFEKKIVTDGDRIAIGPFTVRAGFEAAPGSLVLEVIPPAAAQNARETERGVVFDYGRAYGLRQRFWNKTLLSIIFVLACAALLLAPVRAGKREVFRAGAMVPGHALFANQCERCHRPWRGPSESRCQDCHGAQIHHAEQASALSCFGCHAEHHEQPVLARESIRACLACHANLKTRSGRETRFVKRITDFTTDHPEFAITVRAEAAEKRLRLSDDGARDADPGTIKLNHALHLRRNLKGPKGPVRLYCKDCHVPAADGALMLPVRYETHCKSCHLLKFEDASPNRAAPHASADLVTGYLRTAYAVEPGPGGPKVRAAEKRLFGTVCAECHKMEQRQSGPAVATPNMIERWFPHARFSHRAHRVLECTGCHTRAARSRKSEDVLIPGIETCQGCHRQEPAPWLGQAKSAPLQCATCHTYHERVANPDWDGPLSVHRLLEGEENQAEPTTTRPYSIVRFAQRVAAAFGR
ncbi:MAG: FHA domain-containing protein [Alphaproteobacteria bacterium]